MGYNPISAIYNIRDYGAVGDGVHDDGPALQAALNDAAAAGGGVIELGRGSVNFQFQAI